MSYTNFNANSIFRMVILGTALASGCGTDSQNATSQEDGPRVVQMNGRAVEIVSAGKGVATVVFESGLGNDWTPWEPVGVEVMTKARVFGYSRPGYGKSDPTNSPRDPGQIVEELRALLMAEGYAPPYILVGHSFGGSYMELFAKRYPGEVSGVVLVEPRHRDFLTACESEGIEGCGIPDSILETLPPVQIAEYRAFQTGAEQIKAAGPFGQYPVLVLTATDHSTSAAWERLWESMLASLANEAAEGKQIMFEGATHNLEVERPHEVAEAILSLVSAQGN
jgi:pimeloyl-ACP methyl ester carboxylesterase